MARNTVRLVARAILFTVLAWCDAVAAETFLHVVSPPGEFVGKGLTETFTEQDGTFQISVYPHEQRGILVSLDLDTGVYWRLHFSPPGRDPFELGPYDLAARHNDIDTPHAILSVTGNSRGCNRSVGRFDLLYLEYDAATNKPIAFAADFEQLCDSNPNLLTGSIRFNAPPPPYPAPKDRDLDGVADHADNCPDFPNATQEDRDYDTVGDACDPDPDFTSSFLYYESTNDYVGQGQTIFVDPTIANFYVEPTELVGPVSRVGGIRVRIESIDNWKLDLWPPLGEELVAGPYPGTWRIPYESYHQPTMDFSGELRGCAYARGWFEVLDIARDPDGTVQRLAVRFAQECGTSPVAFSDPLHGLVYFNATSGPFPPYPDSDGDGVLDTLDICIDDFDPIQVDSDIDGIGDACDPAYGETWVDIDGTESHYVARTIDDRFHSDTHLFVIERPSSTALEIAAYGWPRITIRLSAPFGRPFVPGPYEIYGAYYSHYGYWPGAGMTLSIDGRGCSPYEDGGWIDILDIAYELDGSISRFAADIHFACRPNDVTELSIRYEVPGSPFPPPLDDDRDGVPDSQDNCVYDANASQHDQDLDGTGDACDPVFNNTFIFFVGYPGNLPDDLTSVRSIVPAEAEFIVERRTISMRDQITVSTGLAVAKSTFRLTLVAPIGERLEVGHYEAPLVVTFDRPQDIPYMYFSHRGNSCSQGAISFDILELAESPTGEITRLTVDFVHRCHPLDYPQFGFLRYNSSTKYRDIQWAEPPYPFCAPDPADPDSDLDANGIHDVCDGLPVPEPTAWLLHLTALVTLSIHATRRARRGGAGSRESSAAPTPK